MGRLKGIRKLNPIPATDALLLVELNIMSISSSTSSTSDQRLTRRGIPQSVGDSSGGSSGGWRRFWAMAASMLFHVSVIVTLGALWTSRPHGTGVEPDRPVGIAVVRQVDGADEYFLTNAGSSISGASDSATPSSSLEASLPSSSDQPIDLNSLLQGLLPSGGAVGNPTDAAGGLSLGDGGPKIGGSRDVPKVKTSVFGIEGEGSRFVYVFDRSDSMNDYNGLPLNTAKEELIQSLQSLGRAHRFQIIFYNDSPLPYGGMSSGAVKMLVGDDNSKAQAISFVRGISGNGGTQHVDALKMGINMGPDIIFFLTDADQPAISARHRDEILVRCSRAGTTIHAIQFGTGPRQGSGTWIENLATETGGKYRYIDVSKPNLLGK